jgi:thioredoxin-related protein
MMRDRLFLLIAFWALTSVAQAQSVAEKMLTAARTQAQAQQKSVLVIFGASWCPDCDVLEDFLGAPEVKPVFDKHFVIVHLNVFEEDGENPRRNTPGGNAVIQHYGGVLPGGVVSLPYMIVIDNEGKLVVNSRRPVNAQGKEKSIGFPNQPEDIAWFVEMLKKGAPSLTDEETGQLASVLKRGHS